MSFCKLRALVFNLLFTNLLALIPITTVYAQQQAADIDFLRQPAASEQFNLSLYQNNYLLPVYYSDKPFQSYFIPQNPNGGKINQTSLQFQFSLKYGLAENLFSDHDDIFIAYTQRANWQAYDPSAYFSDTQYQPEIFYTLYHNWQKHGFSLNSSSLGFEHQSNGKGGIYERSWNRVYLKFIGQYQNFSYELKPWVRIHFPDSTDYNSDINHYMGYGHIKLNWHIGQQLLSLTLRNQIESGFARGYQELSWKFTIYKKLQGYLLMQSGYGLTVSTYNHYDNAVGIGISF